MNNKKKDIEDLLKIFEERKILSNCANAENFLSLSEKERIIYWGIDCTSDSLHVGHLSILMQIFRLSEKNFKIIFILGGSTSTIGDPSDKTKERPILEKKIIKKNYHSIKGQLERILERKIDETKEIEDKPLFCFYKKEVLEKIYEVLNINIRESKEKSWVDFINFCLPKKSEKSEDFLILNNEEWLSEIKFIDFVNEYGKNVTINYLMSKENMKKRISSKNGISFSEFSYSLLQGYDFLYLHEKYGCNGQVGASDQWGNFTTGLKMINNKKNKNEKSFALSFNLMLDKNGKKISKSSSENNTIWMCKEKTSMNRIFDYFNNMEDNETINFILKFTSIPKFTIEKIEKINNPKSLRIFQRILIEAFIFLIHGKEGVLWTRQKMINLVKN